MNFAHLDFSDEFLETLVSREFSPREQLQFIKALRRTINVTAWHGDHLVGCVRLLSDGYFFGTITEILVDPAWQRQGIGRRLMELAWEASPTGLFFGSQPGNEGFFEKLGSERSLQSYARRKPRQGVFGLCGLPWK